MTELPQGTVTLLFTDIEGSTQLQHRLGEGYQQVVAEHRRLLEEAFAAHQGTVVDRQTESFFVAFARARQAVEAASAAQQALAEHVWPEGVEVKVRMGIHSGDPEVAGDRYVGLAVSRAARICACAHGGQVLFSSSARGLLSDHDQASLRPLGFYRLKDFSEPEPISQLVIDGLPSQFPPLRTEAAPSRRKWLLAVGVVLLVFVGGAIAGLVLALSGGSSGSLAGLAPGSVGKIDPGDGALVQEFQAGGSPTAVAVGDGAVWTANETDRTVSRIDLATGRETTISVGAHPDSIAVGAGGVWAGSRIEGTVLRIDPQLLDVTQRTSVSTRGSISSSSSDLAIGAGSVWAATDGTTVSRIASETGRVRASITPDAGANAVVFRAGSVWVGGQGAATRDRSTDDRDLAADRAAAGGNRCARH